MVRRQWEQEWWRLINCMQLTMNNRQGLSLQRTLTNSGSVCRLCWLTITAQFLSLVSPSIFIRLLTDIRLASIPINVVNSQILWFVEISKWCKWTWLVFIKTCLIWYCLLFAVFIFFLNYIIWKTRLHSTVESSIYFITVLTFWYHWKENFKLYHLT